MTPTKKIGFTSLFLLILSIVLIFVVPPYTLFPKVASEDYNDTPSNQEMLGVLFFMLALLGFILSLITLFWRKRKKK